MIQAIVTSQRFEGNFEAARRFSERALTLSPVDSRCLYVRVVLEYEVGDFKRGAEYLARLLEVMGSRVPEPSFEQAFPALAIPLVAMYTGETQQLKISEQLCRSILATPTVTPWIARLARIGLALAAVLQGEVNAAREQYPILESFSGKVCSFTIVDDRVLGLLAQTIGNLGQATEHFEDGLM